MRDINLDGLKNIKASKELIEKTVNKVMNNNSSKNYFNIKRSIAVAASLAVIVGSVSFYTLFNSKDLGKGTSNKIAADGNVTQNKNVVDSNDTASKSIVDSNDATSKTVVDSKVIPKAVEDIKNNPDKALEGTNATVSNPVAKKSNATTNKPVADSKVEPNKSVPDNNASLNKPVAFTNVINIPAISLNTSKGTQSKMYALIVYKGKIYIESNTQLDPKNIKNILGEKIGRTINSIDEWNVEAKSSEELASNIGAQDVYTAKGYEDDFRIMSYSDKDGIEYAQFFDCLNGITVKSGKDIFGKLNLEGNIESAKYLTFDDWNNGTDNYIPFENINLLMQVSKDLNTAVPYNYESVEKDVNGSRNNSEFREFTLKLKDGSELKFTAFKKGYVSYGNSSVYFKVESSVIDKLW